MNALFSSLTLFDYSFIALAYLIGAIPFGLVLTRLAGYGDIRKIGSGNIGATNVLRTGNKPLALATLLLDALKGAIMVLIARYTLNENIAILAGGAAVLGHVFPLYLGFKGGKGVATTLAVLLAISPLLGFIACLAWIATFLLSKISSLSAITAMIAISIAAFILSANPLQSTIIIALALLVIVRHHENIKRLIKGEEKRSSFSKKS